MKRYCKVLTNNLLTPTFLNGTVNLVNEHVNICLAQFMKQLDGLYH